MFENASGIHSMSDIDYQHQCNVREASTNYFSQNSFLHATKRRETCVGISQKATRPQQTCVENLFMQVRQLFEEHQQRASNKQNRQHCKQNGTMKKKTTKRTASTNQDVE